METWSGINVELKSASATAPAGVEFIQLWLAEHPTLTGVQSVNASTDIKKLFAESAIEDLDALLAKSVLEASADIAKINTIKIITDLQLLETEGANRSGVNTALSNRFDAISAPDFIPNIPTSITTLLDNINSAKANSNSAFNIYVYCVPKINKATITEAFENTAHLKYSEIVLINKAIDKALFAVLKSALSNAFLKQKYHSILGQFKERGDASGSDYATAFNTEFESLESSKIAILVAGNAKGHLGALAGRLSKIQVQESLGMVASGPINGVSLDLNLSESDLKEISKARGVVLKTYPSDPTAIYCNVDLVMANSQSAIKTISQIRTGNKALRSIVFYATPLILSDVYPKNNVGALAASLQAGQGVEAMANPTSLSIRPEISNYEIVASWSAGALNLAVKIFDVYKIIVVNSTVELNTAQEV